MSPGPVLVMRYGSPVLIRRFNALPPPEQNGGFGVPDVSTHLHNFHSGPESDGAPCDPAGQRFFYRGQYYDYYHNLCRAGWNSTHPADDGDVRESLGFLWYHDHRVDHTAENTYKGLVGPAIVFNEFDTGDENTGFRLPSFPQYDMPLVFADKLIDPATGLLVFDTFNFDGLLGNTFLVNGKVQPFHEVQKRRYRFRILDVGPSRFYEVFLDQPRQSVAEDPVLGDLQRRQPPASADRGHELPPRRGRARRHHRGLQQGRPALREPCAPATGEPARADQRAGADRQDPARRAGRPAHGVPAHRRRR